MKEIGREFEIQETHLKHLAILGSTGSIGESTLRIVENYPERFAVVSLAAGRNLDAAFEQCRRWRPRVVSLAEESLAGELRTRLRAARITGVVVVHGTAGTVHAATLPEVDFVVSAIVGVAGLEATYAAIAAGKSVGIANKECMVAAGEILLAEARRTGAILLPIDSEHNAVHQCMRAGKAQEVRSIWLTASGGPFRALPLDQFQSITVAQALKHPTWVMGRRITIDSATMLNKGLEIIEACRLFGLPPSAVRVTVHPQSTIHSLVEFVDGSILAQLSVTDMRLPILYALTYPERIASDLTFDMAALSQLDFSPPDFARFPCLAWRMKRPNAAANIASRSTPRMKLPSKPSSPDASPSLPSRVQLRLYSRQPRTGILERFLKCSTPIKEREGLPVNLWPGIQRILSRTIP